MQLGPGTLYGALARLEARRTHRTSGGPTTGATPYTLEQHSASARCEPAWRASRRWRRWDSGDWRVHESLASSLSARLARAIRRGAGGAVENERLSLRLVVDLVAGVLDARFNPRLPPGADVGGTHEGAATMRRMIVHCEPLHLTMAEQWKSAGLMIGAAVVLAGIATGLEGMVRLSAAGRSLHDVDVSAGRFL